MDLANARVELRPRSGFELFDLALRWCVEIGGRLYLRLAVVTLVPAVALCYAVRLQGAEWFEVWLLAVPLAAVLQGPFTLGASRLMFEDRVRAREVIGRFSLRSPAYLLALGCTWVYEAVGGLLVVLYPFAAGQTAFFREALLLEGHGPFAGLRRSFSFASGQLGSIIGLLFGMALAFFGAIIGADVLGGAMMEFVLQLGRPFGSLWDDGGSLGALVGLFAAVPFLASVRFLFYIDARTRRDGWDVQLRFMALAMQELQEHGPTTGGGA